MNEWRSQSSTRSMLFMDSQIVLIILFPLKNGERQSSHRHLVQREIVYNKTFNQFPFHGSYTSPAKVICLS